MKRVSYVESKIPEVDSEDEEERGRRTFGVKAVCVPSEYTSYLSPFPLISFLFLFSFTDCYKCAGPETERPDERVSWMFSEPTDGYQRMCFL